MYAANGLCGDNNILKTTTTIVAFKIAPFVGIKRPKSAIHIMAELPTINPDTGNLKPWMIPPNMASHTTHKAIIRK